MPATPELITISRMKSARRCLRHHYYSYELGRVPIQVGIPLFLGTLFHVALEAWWLCWKYLQERKPDSDAIDHASEWALHTAVIAMRKAFREGQDDSVATVFDLAKAEEMMRGYHFRWLAYMVDFEILGVESQFIMPMISPSSRSASRTFQLAGKIDVRVRMADGTCRTIEHKTSSEDITPGATYWTRLRMDGQVSQYMDGAKSLGDDTTGCIYDVVRKPGAKQRLATPVDARKYKKPIVCGGCRQAIQQKAKAEGRKRVLVKNMTYTKGCEHCEPPALYVGQRDSDETIDEYRKRVREAIAEDPEKYYQRLNIVRLSEEMVEFRYDTWKMAGIMRASQLDSRGCGRMAWPRNPDGCWKWSRACEYIDVCDHRASIDDDMLFKDKKGQHSELDLG